jgi:hypothetical protein
MVTGHEYSSCKNKTKFLKFINMLGDHGDIKGIMLGTDFFVTYRKPFWSPAYKNTSCKCTIK